MENTIFFNEKSFNDNVKPKKKKKMQKKLIKNVFQ